MRGVPIVRPEDTELAQGIEEDIWSLDAPWVRFLSCRPRPRYRSGLPTMDLLVGVEADCPHDDLEVCAVVSRMIEEGDYDAHCEVEARRGIAR